MPSLPTLPPAPGSTTGTSAWAGEVAAWLAFLADPPHFVGLDTTGTSVTTGGSGVPLSLDTIEIDNETGWSGVFPTRYTAQYPGRYLVIATCVWPSNATGRRSSSIMKNGVTNYNDSNATVPASVAAVIRTQAVREVLLAATDYVQCQGFQDSGGTLTGVTGSLQALWVGTS